MFSHLYPLPYLPGYVGPYKVGTTEVEVPVSEITGTNATINDITTIKFRIFYPTETNAKPVNTSSVYWLPEPQKEWTEAYASFMGASSGWTSFMATSALSMLKYVKLPTLRDSVLTRSSPSKALPVCIFSHGLGGTLNSYSSIVGNLASTGVICFVPEHRDGSAPISFIRDAQGHDLRSVAYQKHSHDPSPKVLNARNAQLRVRLWELEGLYSVIEAINQGTAFSNFATATSSTDNDSWLKLKQEMKDRLDLRPGRATFTGHSFGAATITQFVKSVFYHRELPTVQQDTKSTSDSEWCWDPLSKHATHSPIVRQITADSPVALLDLWTMPLRGEPTRWLFEKPMPCYSRKFSEDSNLSPSTVSVMSAEFYKWTDLLNRTRAALSEDPATAHTAFESSKRSSEPELPKNDTTRSTNPIPELSKQSGEASRETTPRDTSSPSNSRTPSPAASSHSVSAANSATSSSTSLDQYSEAGKSPANPLEPHLYLVTQSAHLSQSDFGVLFPNLTKYVMKAIEPEKTLELNLRAILAMMKGQGLPVQNLTAAADDQILAVQLDTKVRKEQRWVRVPLAGPTEMSV